VNASTTEVLHSSLLDSIPWVEHGFGTRLLEDWPGGYTRLKQIHSDLIYVAEGEAPEPSTQGDALVTSEAGRWIGIRTADCVPLLMADPEKRVVAAVHAGWRGTAANIAGKTVSQMTSLGVDPANLRVAIGPAIGGCCFEVGEEVLAEFSAWLPEAQAERSQAGRPRIDLLAVNRRQLRDAGVRESHIDLLDRCTKCEPDLFHSFRRDREIAGRMVAAIRIRSASL
jgi:polyphenol oxidase